MQKQRKRCEAELIHSRLTSRIYPAPVEREFLDLYWNPRKSHIRVMSHWHYSVNSIFFCYIIIYLMIIFDWGSSYLILSLEICIVLVFVFVLEIPRRTRSKIYMYGIYICTGINIMCLWNGLTDLKNSVKYTSRMKEIPISAKYWKVFSV